MSYELAKANLNLYAVLRNIEDLALFDSVTSSIISDWNLSIEFSVFRGPRGYLAFAGGQCKFNRGKAPSATIRLFFISPAHFNKMMDNKGNPIILRGFRKIFFLLKKFPKVTERLEYFLNPDDKKLGVPNYLEVNTRLTLNTAVYSIKELSSHDPRSQLNAKGIRDGRVLFEILPEGPNASVTFTGGNIEVTKEAAGKPMAVMQFKDNKVANDLLNGKSDAFAALASGDVVMKGQVSMIEKVNLILDRIPQYLAPL